MDVSKECQINITKQELEVLINAVGSSQPINKDYEILQFKLYHKLLFKMNEFK